MRTCDLVRDALLLGVVALVACTNGAPVPAAPAPMSTVLVAVAPVASASGSSAREAPERTVPPPEDPTAAVARCERGEAAGCREAGRLYYEGWGIPRDSKKALALLRKACDITALAYQRGNRTNKDIVAAYDLYARGCEETKDEGDCMFRDDLKKQAEAERRKRAAKTPKK